MKYKCNKARQPITNVEGHPFACQGCDGVITIEGSHVIAPTIRGGLWSYPRIASAGFDCPATTTDPANNELVEVIE